MTAKKELARLRRLTSYASVAVAGTLIAAKFGAYIATESVALLSSLVDSGVDLLASIITAYGIAQAMQPPDRTHRFGHGKAESLAALGQSAFIVGSSVMLASEAVDRFVKPKIVENTGTGLAVMGLAIVLTIALLALQSYTIRRTKSLAIAADRMHYVGDVLINLAVMASLAGQAYFDLAWLDPLFALFIAGSMVYGAVQIFRKALSVLMDEELPDAERTAILALAKEIHGIKGAHDLRTRSDSEHPFIEMHLEMNGSLSLKKAHDIADQVSDRLQKAYPGADVLIHQDPVGVEEEHLDQRIEKNDPAKK